MFWGKRTLACHLPGWEEALPPGGAGQWPPRRRPPLADRRGAVVYELHVRDFSAGDPSVPEELRGKYLAFAQEGTRGDKHLRALAAAGVTHVQLLPTYDFGSVPERAEDRREPEVPAGAGPASELQQAAVEAAKDTDAFNWGYDPVLYDVPEGSYATRADGAARVSEHRAMVAALHDKGLRVVLDVVGGPRTTTRWAAGPRALTACWTSASRGITTGAPSRASTRTRPA
ncbi:unnamed protein product [Prorocentrum cordatum]|uniref:Alpha-amylase n=1 Tax=Prorocentrum cordatum TaxID=2364126 RepID=A0ABN9SWQ3_9DINO|nr:unnamed protein product [Polarella glacialis]